MLLIGVVFSFLGLLIQENKSVEFRVYFQKRTVTEGELFLFRCVVVNNTSKWIEATNFHSYHENKCIQIRNTATDTSVIKSVWAEGCDPWPEMIPPKDSVMDIFLLNKHGMYDSLGRVWYLQSGEYTVEIPLFWRYEDGVNLPHERETFIDTLSVLERTPVAEASFLTSRVIAQRATEVSLESLYEKYSQSYHYRLFLQYVTHLQCLRRPDETIEFVFNLLRRGDIQDPYILTIVGDANIFLGSRMSRSEKAFRSQTALTKKIITDLPEGNVIRMHLETLLRHYEKRRERRQ